jgi:hypothetical protein
MSGRSEIVLCQKRVHRFSALWLRIVSMDDEPSRSSWLPNGAYFRSDAVEIELIGPHQSQHGFVAADREPWDLWRIFRVNEPGLPTLIREIVTRACVCDAEYISVSPRFLLARNSVLDSTSILPFRSNRRCTPMKLACLESFDVGSEQNLTVNSGLPNICV